MSTGEHQYDDVEGPRDGSLGAGQAQGLAQGPNTLGQKAHSMCWFLELSNVLHNDIQHGNTQTAEDGRQKKILKTCHRENCQNGQKNCKCSHPKMAKMAENRKKAAA